MTDVTTSVQAENYGLITGMRRVAGGIDPEIVRRVNQRPDASSRDIMRMDPLGNRAESLDGVVHDVVQLRLGEKFGIEPGTVGAQIVGSLFPGMNAVQITVLVDEIAVDPDAVDFLSYTVWCESTKVTESLSKGHTVSLTATPIDILGIERRWFSREVEVFAPEG